MRRLGGGGVKTITREDALRFELLHAEAHRSLGYELVPIEAGPIDERVQAVEWVLSAPSKFDLARIGKP